MKTMISLGNYSWGIIILKEVRISHCMDMNGIIKVIVDP